MMNSAPPIPKVCLLTYADENYAEQQLELHQEAINMDQFDRIFSYTRGQIDPEFMQMNKYILSFHRGGGYWLWKPYFILRALQELSDGDILLYMDCGDSFTGECTNLKDTLLDLLANEDIYLTVGGYRHGDWTKRDCFHIMNCDTPEYHNKIQLEAGMGVFKKTQRTMEIVNEWLMFSKNSAVITDDPNICGMGNLPGFKDHRHDQSILTNIYIRKSLPAGNHLRQFIVGNGRE